jgi:hypothetical protein
MTDLNSDLAQRKSRRAACAAVVEAVKGLSLKEQRETLLDVLCDVEDELAALQIAAPAPKAKLKLSAVPAVSDSGKGQTGASGDVSGAPDDGATALIVRTLKASRQAMTAKEICDAVRQHKADITLPTVLKTLSRLRKKHGSGLIRRGKRGEYRYTIREVSAA